MGEWNELDPNVVMGIRTMERLCLNDVGVNVLISEDGMEEYCDCGEDDEKSCDWVCEEMKGENEEGEDDQEMEVTCFCREMDELCHYVICVECGDQICSETSVQCDSCDRDACWTCLKEFRVNFKSCFNCWFKEMETNQIQCEKYYARRD